MSWRWIVIGFLCAGTAEVYSQNLVGNSSFETYTALPAGYGEWSKCSGWSNVNGFIPFAWPYASPDYLHTSGGAGVHLPFTTFATVNAYDGNAIMGFVTWHGTTADFREYLSTTLTPAMTPGVTYEVSFWLTNGSSAWYCGASADHFGIKFSTAGLYQATHEHINTVPQLEYPGEFWSTSWQYVSFLYTPDSAYDHITIGNFYADALTAHTTQVAAISNAAYYFIDAVVVMPAAILPITLAHLDAVPVEKAILVSWETESEFNVQSFIVERSTDNGEFIPLGEVPAAGYSTEPHNYTFTDPHPWTGMNYYRLRVTDMDSTSAYSEMVGVQWDAHAVFIYPNPCSDHFTISGLEPGDILRIVNVQGMLMTEQTADGNTMEVQTEVWLPGMYFVQIESAGKCLVEKLIIR